MTEPSSAERSSRADSAGQAYNHPDLNLQQTVLRRLIWSPPDELCPVFEMTTCEAIIFDLYDDHRHCRSPNLGEGRDKSAAVATNKARFLND